MIWTGFWFVPIVLIFMGYVVGALLTGPLAARLTKLGPVAALGGEAMAICTARPSGFPGVSDSVRERPYPASVMVNERHIAPRLKRAGARLDLSADRRG